MGELRVQYTLGGGESFYGSPYRRGIQSTGLDLCPATIILMFAKRRLELGVNFDGAKPFHRFGDGESDFVRYSTVYNALKKENKQQGVKGRGITPHNLRSGGADANPKAHGDAATEKFGNWLTSSYRVYVDSSNTSSSRLREMILTETTNADCAEAYCVSSYFRKHLAESPEAMTDQMSPEIVHGEKVEEELRAHIGDIWFAGSVAFRLLSVGTYDLEVQVGKKESDIRLEAHVVGCYIEAQKYSRAEVTPYGAIECSTAQEVLGWIKDYRSSALDDFKEPEDNDT